MTNDNYKLIDEVSGTAGNYEVIARTQSGDFYRAAFTSACLVDAWRSDEQGQAWKEAGNILYRIAIEDGEKIA